ncbi:MAG: hypothetical protein ACYSTY_10560, partial [Planctomycetota bacterium]
MPSLDFFNLTQSPFQANPPGPLVLETGPLRRAVAWIRTELQSGTPRVLLTGSCGIGKTSVALALPHLLQDRVACLLDVTQPWRELEVSIARQFSLANESLARDTLLGDGTDLRRVLVVDDAELLPDETVSKLQDVLGFEDRGGCPLVRCLVLANPDRAKPNAAATRWMQAVQSRAKLDAMLARELSRYIEARLLNAGWEGGKLFSDEATRTVHRLSHGVPQIADQICDRALVAAADRESTLIGADMIEAAREEVISSLRSASSPSAGLPSDPRSSEAEPDAAEAPAAADRSRRPWFRFDRTFGIEPADLEAALERMRERINRHRKVLAMGFITVTGALVLAGVNVVQQAEHRATDPADAGAIEPRAWPDDLEFTLDTVPATLAAPSPKLVLPEPEFTQSLTGGGEGLHAGSGSDAGASAAMWLRRAAEQGHAEAQLQLATLDEQGRGVEASDTQAQSRLRSAADGGSADAEFHLGVMYEEGRGVAVDPASAARWYRRSAERGDARAQRRLGTLYANGRGVPEDYAQAIQWLGRAAEQGDVGAQVELAVMYAGGVADPGSVSKAIKWFRKAASGGDALAQALLGIMYVRGEGVDQDDAQAAAWFRKAAAQGNSLAQFNLGVMLDKRRISSDDDSEAIHLYRLAAAQGNADAELTLGGLYAAGRDVEHDDAKAVDWFRRAANQGNPVAQFNLGVMLDQGRGAAKDGVEAMRWYRESAKQGYPPAQITLARLYASGLGVAEDDAAAALWYRRAAELGSADAQYQLGLILLAGEGVAQDAELALRWLREAAQAGHAG